MSRVTKDMLLARASSCIISASTPPNKEHDESSSNDSSRGFRFNRSRYRTVRGVRQTQAATQSVQMREHHQSKVRLLPTKAAALYLGVSVKLVRRWCREARLNPIKNAGKNWLFDVYELDLFVEELKHER